MRRAIVVFVEDKRDLIVQFMCLYTSLKFINNKDTDIVVFGTEEALEKIPDDCLKYTFVPPSKPEEFNNYPYINSLCCLLGNEADVLDKYDFILRSDVDTFLTPSWNEFFPEKYTVGKGAYVFTDEVKEKITSISNQLKLNHRGLHNLGSTHYGKPNQIRSVCKLAVEVAEHLLTTEFRYTEGEWPGWYRGVTTMYSCEIAMNHLVSDIKVEAGKLDFDSTSQNFTTGHPHIHCWHTDELFSKFQFSDGNYDHIQRNQLKIEYVRDYCLYIALLSKEIVY
ncbi:DUF7164 domain-containing protein [Lysinibacillus antri]|uniref:DUF7164 domain-containing protein n=1 Tax=Lysinibacillus antri TaxID=2498145 RepID=A0A432L896_9BACI|nr:hypothetical protein [Lysinibacillus antri]RUL48673.1 hypothetical protein EK386_16440 [Lysinibacillus antri]